MNFREHIKNEFGLNIDDLDQQTLIEMEKDYEENYKYYDTHW